MSFELVSVANLSISSGSQILRLKAVTTELTIPCWKKASELSAARHCWKKAKAPSLPRQRLKRGDS